MITFNDIAPFLDGPTPASQAKIQVIIDHVIADFEARTKRLWKQRTDEVFNFRPEEYGSMIYVNMIPLSEVDLIEEADHGADYEVVDVESYEVDLARGIITRIDVSPNAVKPWRDRVRVTASGGFSAAPNSIKLPLMTQMLFLLKRNAHANIDVWSLAISPAGGGGGSTRFLDPDMHPLYKRAVKAHSFRTFG